MEGQSARALVRAGLALVVFAGTAGIILAAFRGLVGPWSAGILAVVALIALRWLPQGSRAAGWLTAVWVALALILLGWSEAVAQGVGLPKHRLALVGGVVYLIVAAAAFWACGGERKGER